MPYNLTVTEPVVLVRLWALFKQYKDNYKADKSAQGKYSQYKKEPKIVVTNNRTLNLSVSSICMFVLFVCV